MMSLPAIVLAAIGVHARTYTDPFVPYVTDVETAKRIEAYEHRVALLNDVSANGGPKKFPLLVRQYVEEWIHSMRAGDLKDVPIRHLSENMRDGVRGQIRDARERLMQALWDFARASLHQGNADAAVDDFMRLVNIAEVAKYSDSYMVAYSALRQRAALLQIQRLVGKLSPAKRKQLAQELATTESYFPKSFDYLNDAKDAYLNAVREDGQATNLGPALTLLRNVSRQVKNGADRAQVLATFQNARSGVGDLESDRFLTEVRNAYSSQEMLRQLVKSLSEELVRAATPGSTSEQLVYKNLALGPSGT